MIPDTNAISALGGRDPALIKRLENVPRLHVTLISLEEYHRDSWVGSPVGSRALVGRLSRTGERAGTPIPANDVWIAAFARQHNQPILSKDANFDHVEKLNRLIW